VTLEPPPRLDFAQILRASVRAYSQNFTPLLLIALATVPVGMLAAALQQAAGADEGSPWLWIAIIPNQLVAYAAIGALVYALRLALAGQRPSATEALDASFARYITLVTSDLLRLSLALLACFSWPFMALWWLVRRDATIDGERNWWLVAVPFALALYLLVRWWFVAQAVMLAERRRWDALDDSAYTVRGNWWRTLGIVGFFSLLRLVGTLLVAGAFDSPVVNATVTGTAMAVVLPLAIAGETLLYFDLKARKQVEPSAAAVTPPEADVQGEGPRDV
jgi:hypothetical protein